MPPNPAQRNPEQDRFGAAQTSWSALCLGASPGNRLAFARGLQAWIWALPLLALVETGPAQVLPADTIRARSASGQFTVYALPANPNRLWLSSYETNRNYARLAPTLLPVSCERIKRILWRTLGETGPWRGDVFVVLTPAYSPDEMVTITSEQFRDGWRYRVELPDFVECSRYVRALVQVLLLEIANRDAVAHSAEIPSWLLEGLAQEILISNSKEEIIPPPPRPALNNLRPASTFTLVNARFENPLRQAHQELAGSAPLSFQDLSWPSAAQLEDPAAGLYRDSAQLFVDRLLAFKNGRACLHSMLLDLRHHYNWQFAFLNAFSAFFQRPLDVEKWWSLQTLQFTGRDLTQTWPGRESWRKLDEAIRSGVQVRVGTNELPLHTAVSLQTLIQEWEPARQYPALEAKLHELELLRPRVTVGLVPLVDDYCRVLAFYLQGIGPAAGKKGAGRQLVTQTLMQLDALDFERRSLKPPPNPPPDLTANDNFPVANEKAP